MLRHRFSSHLALDSEDWSLLPATTNFTTTVRGKKLQHFGADYMANFSPVSRAEISARLPEHSS